MSTILHNHQLGTLRGFVIALLLALCLTPASAEYIYISKDTTIAVNEGTDTIEGLVVQGDYTGSEAETAPITTVTFEGSGSFAGASVLVIQQGGICLYGGNIVIRNCQVKLTGTGIYGKPNGTDDNIVTVDNGILHIHDLSGSTPLDPYGINGLTLLNGSTMVEPYGGSFVAQKGVLEADGETVATSLLVSIGQSTGGGDSPSTDPDTTTVAQDKLLTSTFSRVGFHGLCIANETTDSLELNWTANALWDYNNWRPILVHAYRVPTTLQSRYNITGTLDSITLNINGQYASSTIVATTSKGKEIGSVHIDTGDSNYNATGSNLYVIKPVTPVTMDDESIILTANFESYRIGVNSVAVNYTGEARTVDWFRYYYNLFIDCIQLNSDMLSVNIPFEGEDTSMEFGATGGITFNPDSLVLTLDNAVIANCCGRVISATNVEGGVVGYDIPDLKVRLKGTSEISGGDGGLNWRSDWYASPASGVTGVLNPIYAPVPNDSTPSDVQVTTRPYSVTLYSEDGKGFLKTLGMSTDSINSNASESFIVTDSLIIDSCKVFICRIGAPTLEMHHSSTLYTGNFDAYNLKVRLDGNIGIIAPKSTYFDDNGQLQGYSGYWTDSCWLVIGPKPAVEIESVQTDTTTAVSLIDSSNFTDGNGGQVSLNNTVIDNVYFSINNSGDDATQTGYYDISDNSIVVTTTTEASTVGDIASSEDPLSAAATSNYTGLIFEVPAGQGTITVETQTFGTTAVAVQAGTEAPQAFTTSTQAEETVSYNVTVNTYVYVYTVAASSEAKGAGRAPAAANGAKIYSVKVKQNGTATGINEIHNSEFINQNSSEPMYNLAGQRVGRNYKGIVIQNGKKRFNK